MVVTGGGGVEESRKMIIYESVVTLFTRTSSSVIFCSTIVKSF